MAGRTCQTCGGQPAALLRGFNGAKDLALCLPCRTRQLHPVHVTSRFQSVPIPPEGPCWVLAGRSYVPAQENAQASKSRKR